MEYESIKRNRYFDPPNNEFEHTSRNHYQDSEEFHRPLARMHHAHVHDWGIARGLEVNGTIDSTEVLVNAGVAIDSRGELIVLSNSGNIGTNPAGGQNQEVTVPVQLDLSNAAGQTRYVTIQFSESLRLNEGAGGRFEQMPWLRLQSPSDYLNDGSSLLLAIVVVSADGKLAELKVQNSELNHRRRLIGETIEELHLRRSIQEGDQVKEVPAGKIAPIEEGLQISVPAQEEGKFANLDVQAKRVTLDGSLAIGTDTPISKLHVVANGPRPPLTLANLDGATGIHLVPKSNVPWTVGANSKGFFVQDNDTLHLVMKADGNLGIGATEPTEKLVIDSGPNKEEVSFLFRSGATSSDLQTWDAIRLKAGWHDTTSNAWKEQRLSIQGMTGVGWSELMTIKGNGNVGIGTTAPGQKFHVANGNAIINNSFLGDAGHGSFWAGFSHSNSANTTGYGVLQSSDGKFTLINKKSGGGFIGFRVDNADKMTIDDSGFVSIKGGASIGTGLTAGGLSIFLGDVIVGGNLSVGGGKGGYVMDQFVNKLGETLEQGDVVVIGENQSTLYYGRDNNIPILEVDVAQSAHNTRVCGIVYEVYTQSESDISGAINFSANPTTTEETAASEELSQPETIDSQTFSPEKLEKLDRTKIEPGQIGWMVTLGAFAHCKVDADIAPIQVGDLLTTSSTKGHAQKVLDSSQAVGAIVGKALGALEKGKGKIPVLVMLQ